MPDETPATAPHPELEGLTARKASLTEKAAKIPAAKVGESYKLTESRQRTALFLKQINDRIAEITKA